MRLDSYGFYQGYYESINFFFRKFLPEGRDDAVVVVVRDESPDEGE